MPSLIEEITAALCEETFLREFCFTAQEFAPRPGQTKELADVLVWLESDCLVVQVKERDGDGACDPKSLDRWYRRKVIGKGSDQIADTLSYLAEHREVAVRNARGQQFRLCELNAANVHKTIIFGAVRSQLGSRCPTRIHWSDRSGPIHLIEAAAFRNLLEWAATPGEMLDYLTFREMAIAKHPDWGSRSEKSLFGCFIMSPDCVAGTPMTHQDGERAVDSLTNDRRSVDLRQFFDLLGTWAAKTDGDARVFHRLLMECAHLRRAEMREFKTRLTKCACRLDKPFPETLYRLVNPRRDCTFVLGVLPHENVPHHSLQARGLTELAKYDTKTSKGIGVFFTPIGAEDHELTPVYIEEPWIRNADTEKFLANSSIFRELRPTTLYGYYTTEGHETRTTPKDI